MNLLKEEVIRIRKIFCGNNSTDLPQKINLIALDQTVIYLQS